MGRIEIYTKDKYKSWKNTKNPQLIPESCGKQLRHSAHSSTHTTHSDTEPRVGCCHQVASGWHGVVKIQEEFQGQGIDCWISSSSTYPKMMSDELFQLWNFTNHQTKKILWHPHWIDGGVTLCGTTGVWVTCFAATGLSGSRNRKEPPRNKSFACTGVITKNHGG